MPFLDQLAQGLFTDDRKDHLAHDPLGVHERGIGQAIEHARFPADPFQVLEEFPFDTAFGPSADAVDQFDEEVHQRVGQLSASEGAEGGEQTHPQRGRMPAEFVGLLHGHTLAVGTEHPG